MHYNMWIQKTNREFIILLPLKLKMSLVQSFYFRIKKKSSKAELFSDIPAYIIFNLLWNLFLYVLTTIEPIF